MADSLYYCEYNENTCPKKEQCRRYVNIEDSCVVPLFKMMCTEDNNYILFLQNNDSGNSKDTSVNENPVNNNSNSQKEESENV